MKGRRTTRDAKPKFSAQLDLFSRPIPACSTLQHTAETLSQDNARAPSPPQELLEYLLGSQKRGRPEKALNVAPTESSDQRRLLDVREAALRLGLSKSTLDKMRCSGRGPRFIRATDRAIRYDPADLQVFADERRRRSTSELAAMMADG